MRRLIVRGPGLRGPAGADGKDGLPGLYAIPADEAVAAYVEAGDTRAAVETAVADFVQDEGPVKAALADSIAAVGDPKYAPVAGSTNYVQNTSLAAEQIRTADAAAMRPWFAALAGRHVAPARLMIGLGDSRQEGDGIAGSLTNRTMERLAARLRGLLPTDGNPVGPPVNFMPVKFVSPGCQALNTRWTTNSPSTSNSFGQGARVVFLGAGHVAQLTAVMTSCKLVWVRSATAASFRWRVDGGAWSTVDASGGLADGRTTDIGPLSAGSHTIDVENVSGSVGLSGAFVYNGDETKGIQVYDFSKSGIRSGSTGYSSNNLLYLTQSVAAVNPHCVVLNLGTNDMGANVAPTDYKLNMEAIIAAVEAGCTLPPTIVLVAEATRTQGGFTYPWSAYVTAMRELVAAAPTRRTLLDLSVRMPPLADNTLGLYADSLHEGNKGHSLKADYMASFLTPR